MSLRFLEILGRKGGGVGRDKEGKEGMERRKGGVRGEMRE